MDDASERIPLFRATIPDGAIDEAMEVLRSGWLTLGPRTLEFERTAAEYLDVPHAVGVDSGTSAMHLALRLLDLPRGAEVITTPNTFVATNHAILYVGGRPVFADIQPDTGNIDPVSIRKHLTDRTAAIVVVHYGGYPCDLVDIYEIADERGIPVVEDCAHAWGAVYRDRRIGSHGAVHAFSLAPAKNIATPGGGVVTVRSDEHDERLRRLRVLGADRDSFRRNVGTNYSWEYEIEELGYRANMNDVVAVLALAQLRELDQANDRRRDIHRRYEDRLRGVSGIAMSPLADDRTSSFYLFWLLVDERDALIRKLVEAGIESAVHFKRNDLYPIYERGDLPNAEYFSGRQISLPLHLRLTDADVDRICDEIEAGW